MMGSLDRSHHVNSWSPEDGIVAGLDVKDTKRYEDVEQIYADWELDGAGGSGFAPVKTIEE